MFCLLNLVEVYLVLKIAYKTNVFGLFKQK